MKKFLVLILFLLTGCGVTSKNFLKKMSKEYEKIEAYSVNGEITIEHTDLQTKYTFETSCYNECLKVTLTNSQTNTKQTIIKNQNGVFVLSPLTNKTYKFPSNWPNESQTPYVLSTVINDVLKDSNVEIIEGENEIVLKCEISSVNSNLTKEEINFNKKTLLPTNVSIYDDSGNKRINVSFSEFNLSPNLSNDDFKIEPNMTSLILEIGEGFDNQEFSLPTFSPYDVTVTQKTLDDAILVSYTGENSYVVYQKRLDTLEVNATFGTYDDLVLLNNTVGLVRDNVLMWCNGGIEYKIYSDTLEISEMIDIANSIL